MRLIWSVLSGSFCGCLESHPGKGDRTERALGASRALGRGGCVDVRWMEPSSSCSCELWCLIHVSGLPMAILHMEQRGGGAKEGV